MNLIYISLFIIGCFLFSFLERYLKISYFKWLFILFFVLLIANRDVKVPDTDAYISFFQQNNNDYGMEIGFYAFTTISKTIFKDNYKLYFALITIINLLIISFSTKKIMIEFIKSEYVGNEKESKLLHRVKTGYTIIPLTLYIAFFGLYFNAIVLRVGIAMSILVLASFFAIKIRKTIADYIIIGLLLGLAYMFHATALVSVLIILLLLLSRPYSPKLYILIWFLSGFIYFSNIFERLGGNVFNFVSSITYFTALSDKLSYYGGSNLFASYGVSMKFVFFWITSLYMALMSGYNKNSIYFKYLNVFIVGVLLFSVFRSVQLVERVTDFFLFYSFIVFSMFLFSKKNIMLALLYFSIIVFQLIFIFRIINR